MKSSRVPMFLALGLALSHAGCSGSKPPAASNPPAASTPATSSASVPKPPAPGPAVDQPPQDNSAAGGSAPAGGDAAAGGSGMISLGGDPSERTSNNPPAGSGPGTVGGAGMIPKGGPGATMGAGVAKGGMSRLGQLNNSPDQGNNANDEPKVKKEPPPPPRELTFKERADDYFAKGEERDAVLLLQAYALADPSKTDEVMNLVRWSKISRQPQVMNRIAVGIDLKNPSNAKEYNPVGTKVASGRGGGGLGGKLGGGIGGDLEGGLGMGGGAGGMGGSSSSEAESELEKIGGEMGRLLIQHIQELRDAGSLGAAFAEVSDVVQSGKGEEGNDRSAQGGGLLSDGMGGGMMGGGMMGGGVPGKKGAAGGNNSPPPGNDQPTLSGGGGGQAGAGLMGLTTIDGDPPINGGGGGNKMSGAGSSEPEVERKPVGKLASPNKRRLTPGLTFIGISSASDLMQKAQSANYDMLLVFDVSIEQKRQRAVQNETRVRLFKPKDKKPMKSTELLNSNEVGRKLDTESNLIEKAMKGLFAKITEVATMTDMPTEFTSETIKKRVEILVEDKTRKPLESLFEIKYWNQKQLLSDEDLKAAYGKLLTGDEANKLLTGDEKERLAVIKKYAP